ncbi:MAG: hypothetical protein U0800_23365 [Isosphaeraceae bacterium]
MTMIDTSEYLYVILDSTGRCYAVGDNGREETPGLASLLRDRWRPVREVPFREAASVLILLERDSPEPKGFGFRT